MVVKHIIQMGRKEEIKCGKCKEGRKEKKDDGKKEGRLNYNAGRKGGQETEMV